MSHTCNDHPAVDVTKKEYLQPMTLNDAGIPTRQKQQALAEGNPSVERNRTWDHTDPTDPSLNQAKKEPASIDNQSAKEGFGSRIKAGVFAAASKVQHFAHDAKEKIRPGHAGHSDLEELPFYGVDLSPKSRPYGTL